MLCYIYINMKESLKNAQKKYGNNNPIIRIDRDTYIWIKNFSDDNKMSIKNVVKMTIDNFKEVERLQTENDLLIKEVERLQTENDLLIKEVERLQTENDLLIKEVERLQTENDLFKEKKGLREGLKGLIFR